MKIIRVAPGSMSYDRSYVRYRAYIYLEMSVSCINSRNRVFSHGVDACALPFYLVFKRGTRTGIKQHEGRQKHGSSAIGPRASPASISNVCLRVKRIQSVYCCRIYRMVN